MRDRQEARRQPVDRFYRVRFTDERALHEWALEVLEVVAAREDRGITEETSIRPERDAPIVQAGSGSAAGARSVVFIRLKASRAGTVYGYVSEAALGLVRGLAQDAEVDGTPMPMRDLPDWLGLLIGSASDATAYERRDLGDV
jgi:hypothetical protein